MQLRPLKSETLAAPLIASSKAIPAHVLELVGTTLLAFLPNAVAAAYAVALGVLVIRHRQAVTVLRQQEMVDDMVQVDDIDDVVDEATGLSTPYTQYEKLPGKHDPLRKSWPHGYTP